MKGFRIIALMLALLLLSGCGATAPAEDSAFGDTVEIVLSDTTVTVDGTAAATEETAAVYLASDIVYYEDGQPLSVMSGGMGGAAVIDEAVTEFTLTSGGNMLTVMMEK